MTDSRVMQPDTADEAHGGHRHGGDAARAQGIPAARDGHDMSEALQALASLDTDRSKLASSYDRTRPTTVIWVAMVYGLLTLTYWMIPQAYLNRFHLPWNPAWIVFALLAVSVLLACVAMTLTARAQGIAVRWMPPAPVTADRRYRIVLAAHFAVNFIPPILALVVGYVTDAWWSALAVATFGAAINGLATYWELDAMVRTLKRRTIPQQDTEAPHGIG